MPIINVKDWEEQERINKDLYGKCCIDVAREVMKLLDIPEYQDFDSHHSNDKNINLC